MSTPLSPAEVAAQLAGVELFAGLSGEALAEVASCGRLQLLRTGTTVFMQGAPAERCHVLIAGRVRIAQSGPEGGEVIVRFVGSGETFGTVALFTDRRYPAGATALIDSIAISWQEPTLRELVGRYPSIALNLIRILGARLREAQERLREIATQRVDQRIAHALLRLIGPSAGANADGSLIEFPLTRQDVAAMCGATLYTVSRVLTAWERAGYIRTRRRQLTICKRAELIQLAGMA